MVSSERRLDNWSSSNKFVNQAYVYHQIDDLITLTGSCAAHKKEIITFEMYCILILRAAETGYSTKYATFHASCTPLPKDENWYVFFECTDVTREYTERLYSSFAYDFRGHRNIFNSILDSILYSFNFWIVNFRRIFFFKIQKLFAYIWLDFIFSDTEISKKCSMIF